MTTQATTAEGGLQPFGLGQALAMDGTVAGNALAGGSFGSLLDQGTGQVLNRASGLMAGGVIPSGVPLTAGCVAQVAAQLTPSANVPQAQQTVAPDTTQAAGQALVQDALAQTLANQPSPTMPSAQASTGKPATKISPTQQGSIRDVFVGTQPATVATQSIGQGSTVCNTRPGVQDATDAPEEDSQPQTGLGEKDSQGSAASDQTQVLLANPELLALIQQPLVAQQTTSPQPELSVDVSATQSDKASTELPGVSLSYGQLQNWTPLKQESSQSQTAQVPAGSSQDAFGIQVENKPSLPDSSSSGVQSLGVLEPAIRSSKALFAYESGFQQDSPIVTTEPGLQANAPAVGSPAIAPVSPSSPGIMGQASVPGGVQVLSRVVAKTPSQAPVQAPAAVGVESPVQAAVEANPQSTPVLRAATETIAQASAPSSEPGATDAATSPTFSMESSTNPTATAKDGDAKDGTPAVLRAGDSTRLSQGANSAAPAATPVQAGLGDTQKKSQSADVSLDVVSSKTDGIRNAKSDPSMSINRRSRTTDTRSEELSASSTSSVPVTRVDTVQAASKTTTTDSAQRAVATVSELVDRMQARPATKVAIDVPLSGDQNVSVKLEYKAGVLHVNFRTDSTEMRDALSREWSTVAAQSDSALRFAEPSFNSKSQDHSQQQQSKADAFDLSWNRQGQQQQRSQQQQQEAPRSFPLPGSRNGSGITSSSATDGVSNRDRTTASRQVAPDTTRHLNVVA
jgi:hypothetical protein